MTTLEDEVDGRSGWAWNGKRAVFNVEASTLCGQVTPTLDGVKRVERWHAVVRDETGVARHTVMGRTPGEAVRWVEGMVRAQS